MVLGMILSVGYILVSLEMFSQECQQVSPTLLNEDKQNLLQQILLACCYWNADENIRLLSPAVSLRMTRLL